jgi:hypothetical protein
MSSPEKVKQLEEQIATAVKQAVRQMRNDLSRRLEENNEALQERLAALESELPTSFVAEDELAAVAADAATEARHTTLEELLAAVAALDGAATQAAVLAALLEQAGRFANRSAIFLTRSHAVVGWGAFGFGDDEATISGLELSYGEDSVWRQLAESAGTLALTAGQCAPLASQLETEVPRGAVLVPLVLHDRLAAVLYADRTGDEEELQVQALQLLVHAASQAIETLPFRRRGSSASLRQAGEGEETGEQLPLWEPMAAAAAATATAPAPPAPAAEEEEAGEPEVADVTEVEEQEVAEEEEAAEVETATEAPEAAPAVEVPEPEALGEPEEEGAAVPSTLGAGEAEAEPDALGETEEETAEEPAEAAEEPEVPQWSGLTPSREPEVGPQTPSSAGVLSGSEVLDAASAASTVEMEAFEPIGEPAAEEPEPLPGEEPPEEPSFELEEEMLEEAPLEGVLVDEEEVAAQQEAPAPADLAAESAAGTVQEEPAALQARDELLPSLEELESTPPSSSTQELEVEATSQVEEPGPTLDQALAEDRTLLFGGAGTAPAQEAVQAPPPPSAEAEAEEPAEQEAPEAAAASGTAAPAEPPSLETPPVEMPAAPSEATPAAAPAAEAVAPEAATTEAPTVEPPPSAPPPPQPSAAAARGSQVAPPSDLSGPGTAFGGGAAPAPGGTADASAHEEGRRLARLLVSEIRLYNEEQVEEGRRYQDIYSRLREDIDRSRKMYEERISEQVRSERDYFHEELVRILADGDAAALGM